MSWKISSFETDDEMGVPRHDETESNKFGDGKYNNINVNTVDGPAKSCPISDG